MKNSKKIDEETKGIEKGIQKVIYQIGKITLKMFKDDLNKK